MVKAVFFDLGGVLVSDLFDYMEPWLAEKTGKTRGFVKEARKRYWLDYELGRMKEYDFWKSILDDIGSSLDPAAVTEKAYTFIKVMDDTLDIVKLLKKSGYRLGVISNISEEWSEYVRLDIGLGQQFDVWSSSANLHIKKPDKEIYRLTAEKLDIEPAECLFIDNKESNVESAIKAGMQAILFKNAGQVKEDMKKQGVEI